MLRKKECEFCEDYKELKYTKSNDNDIYYEIKIRMVKETHKSGGRVSELAYQKTTPKYCPLCGKRL
ncbi:MAG: hypothetical protein Q4F05_11305 [bacterium]|nr:hypothetical protein [bacterium]